jgi:hypothetical protein
LTVTRRAGIEHDHSIRVTLFTITLLNPVLAPGCTAAHHCPESVRTEQWPAPAAVSTKTEQKAQFPQQTGKAD